MWQNIMPDISTKLIKSIDNVSFHPNANYFGTSEAKKDLLSMSKTGGNLGSAGLSEVCPGQFLNTKTLSKNFQKTFEDDLVYYNDPFIPSDSSAFFEELKWLVFKVKQRAAKDYESYRSRQIDAAIASKGYQRKR